MKINLQAPFSISPKLENLTRQQLEKLESYFDRISSATVYFRHEENRGARASAQTVEIRLQVPGQTLFAQDTAQHFEQSLASAANKVRNQLLRFKGQLARH